MPAWGGSRRVYFLIPLDSILQYPYHTRAIIVKQPINQTELIKCAAPHRTAISHFACRLRSTGTQQTVSKNGLPGQVLPPLPGRLARVQESKQDRTLYVGWLFPVAPVRHPCTSAPILEPDGSAVLYRTSVAQARTRQKLSSALRYGALYATRSAPPCQPTSPVFYIWSAAYLNSSLAPFHRGATPIDLFSEHIS